MGEVGSTFKSPQFTHSVKKLLDKEGGRKSGIKTIKINGSKRKGKERQMVIKRE